MSSVTNSQKKYKASQKVREYGGRDAILTTKAADAAKVNIKTKGKAASPTAQAGRQPAPPAPLAGGRPAPPPPAPPAGGQPAPPAPQTGGQPASPPPAPSAGGQPAAPTEAVPESESTSLLRPTELRSESQNTRAGFTQDQKESYNTVMSIVYGAQNTGKGNLLILNGPGYTGKTWFLNQILEGVACRGDIALEVESKGNDAYIFDGNRKVKLPLSLVQDTPEWEIENNIVALLRKIKVIVWDDCTKMNYRGFEALDTILREVCDKNVPFADIPVLLAGDYRQTQGTPSDDTKAFSESSPLWSMLEPYWNQKDAFRTASATLTT